MPATESQDEVWISRALDLARRGIGLASPNPTVGCVLVQGNAVIGEGFHEYDKRDHAEIVALKAAGELARGATAYVTLEPCSHQGRTGPCSDALIRAGVRRVVVATADPNPAVNGQGIARLRAAGTEVAIGTLAEEAQRLNDGFVKHIRTGLPFVTLKVAQSLDGRIASPPEHRTARQIHWITGEASRQHVQQMRHSVDAVITGIGTVLEDDPLLTDRSGLPRRRPLLRVVLDSSLKLPLDSQLARSTNGEVLVFCTAVNEDRARALGAAGVRVEQIEAEDRGPSLKRVIERLGALEITSAMIEAGTRVNTRAIGDGIVDRLFLFYAPYFLGSRGVPVVSGMSDQPINLRGSAIHRFGSDFAFEGWLNDPWKT